MALRTLRLAVLLTGGVVVSCAGCLRAPIGDEPHDGSADGGSGVADDDASATTLLDDDTQGDPDADADASTTGPCHPSYDPCLPIVDDLDCPDVEALGAAPVTVIGEDVYGLDRDNDGIGCEP